MTVSWLKKGGEVLLPDVSPNKISYKVKTNIAIEWTFCYSIIDGESMAQNNEVLRNWNIWFRVCCSNPSNKQRDIETFVKIND